MFDRYQEQFLIELDDIKIPFNSLLNKTKLSKGNNTKISDENNDDRNNDDGNN